MNIFELKESLKTLNRQAKIIMKDTGYETYAELCNVDYDKEDPNQVFLFEEFGSIISALDRMVCNVDYLNRPVRYEGVLTCNQNDRYELCGVELSSGYGIEVFIYDDFYDRYTWYAGTIEHNGKEYYLVGKPQLKLEGVKARIRK